MAVNINCNVTDAFYRYKMPKLITKVEGKGNGIKTVIVNMSDIGKALSRPPTYPTKFFGCELGAQTQFDLKNERFIVNGDHNSARLQELLHTFIRKFVLCSECDNPETNMIVKEKKGLISLRCIACGHTTNVDMRHKLTTFILKNPPNAETTHGATPSKKEKKTSKKDKDRSSPEANKEKEQDEDPVIEAPPVNNKNKNDSDDDWGDLDEEAEKKRRMDELSAGAAKLVMEDDNEKTAAERLEIFYNFLKAKKDSNKLSGADKVILAEAERLDVKDKATMVLAEILLSENVLKEVKDYRLIFLRFTHENPKAQKYLIGGLELLIGDKYKDTLMPKVAHIFKLFYDLDIIEEEIILEWDKKVSKKYVSKEVAQEIHNKAGPFITWLKEAEEEEEESEEEDEDLEIEYKEGVTKIESQKVAPAGKPAAPANGTQEDDEDDLDIDDI